MTSPLAHRPLQRRPGLLDSAASLTVAGAFFWYSSSKEPPPARVMPSRISRMRRSTVARAASS